MANRMLGLCILITLGIGSMGAKGDGCNGADVSYSPGDGSPADWKTGPVPVPAGDAQPMTCSWLTEGNCWTPLYEHAATCAPEGKGKFSADRKSCTFPDGSLLEFDAALSTPEPNHVLFPIVQYRLLGADGDPCVTGKILGVGKSLLDVQGDAVVFTSTTLLAYQLTCPDGSVFDDGAEGTCQDVGSLYLQHKTPGQLLSCNGNTGECTLELWGAAGPEAIATCAP